MMKYSITLLSLLFFGCVTLKSNIPFSFSTRFYKSEENKEHQIWTKKEYKLLRSRHIDDSLNINSKNDTLYILKSANVEYNTYGGAIWNSREEIQYDIHGNQIIVFPKIKGNQRSSVTSRLYSLIEDWNIDRIKYLSENEPIEHGGSTMNGLRLIIKDENITIEIITFKSVFPYGDE